MIIKIYILCITFEWLNQINDTFFFFYGRSSWSGPARNNIVDCQLNSILYSYEST